MPFHRTAVAAAAAVLLSAGVAACGSSSSTTSTTTTNAGGPTATSAQATPTTGASAGGVAGTITIQSFMFKPNPDTVKVGDTITVKNMDTTAHTFTADDSSFDTKPIDAGTTATVKLTKAGTFAYHCNIHQFMHGTINVSA